MRGFRIGRSLLVAVALTPLLLTGCDDGGGTTGPEDIDLSATAVALEEAVETYLLENRAILSIAALSGAMSEACGGGVSLGATPPLAAMDLLSGRAPRALLDLGEPEAIAEACLGESLVMNPATGEYETGGPGDVPANGVRFELYDVDTNGDLVSPLTAIGYVEIVDSSTETALSGSFRAVIDGATLINFTGELTGSETTLTIEADGFFSADGSTQLEVTMDAGINVETGDISASAEIETSEISSTVTVEGEGDAENEEFTASFEARVEHGANTVIFDGTFDEDGNVTGDVLVNGSVVASFTVDVETEQLVITDESDGALSDDDLAALESMFESALTGFATILVVGLLLFALSGGF